MREKIWLLVLFLWGVWPHQAQGDRKAERPPRWAVKVEHPHLSNLYKVSDALYRGAQPEEEGMKALQAMGIKTVVNLRSMHSDREYLKGTTLGYEHIPFYTTKIIDDQVIRFLRIMADPGKHPVFLHCKHGADRTGMLSALYRIIFQGWSRDEALREMIEGGFGFHSIWKHLPDYVRNVDIEALKARAGLSAPPKTVTNPPR